MATQMAFYVDLRACIGCKACQIACKDKNDLGPDRVFRRVVEVTGGEWVQRGDAWATTAFAYYLPTACMHCEAAPCVTVCPTTAMQKRDDGVVLVDQTKCIGCRYCEWACPYGAPQFNEAKGVMTKCTFCEDLLAQGQNPACVDACVMRAIKFGELADLRAKYGNFMDMEPLPASWMTNPSVVITPHKHSQFSGQGTGTILNAEEEL